MESERPSIFSTPPRFHALSQLTEKGTGIFGLGAPRLGFQSEALLFEIFAMHP